MLDKAVLSFVGVAVLGTTRITSVERSTLEDRRRTLARVEAIGRADAKRVLRRLSRSSAGGRDLVAARG